MGKANSFNVITPNPQVIWVWAHRIPGSTHFCRSLCLAHDEASLRGDWHVASSRVFAPEWTRGDIYPPQALNPSVDFEIIYSKVPDSCLWAYHMT
jgi:hypothetical protein